MIIKRLVSTNRSFIPSPTRVFMCTWVATVFLHSLQITNNISAVNPMLLVLLIIGGMLFALFDSVARMFSQKSKNAQSSILNAPKINKILLILLILWGMGSVVEIFYAGGVPILWLYSGNSATYEDFGIPSLHGFLNAIYFCICGLTFYVAISGNKRFYAYFILLLLWPVITLTRASLVFVVVQAVIIYFSISRLTLLDLITKLLIFSLFFIVTFGVLGEIRSPNAITDSIVNDSWREIINKLPPGFLWVYIYITSPFENLNSNFSSINLVYDFQYSLFNLVPTFLRDLIIDRADSFTLVDARFNVSTFFASSHSDFGFVGDCFLLLIYAMWCSWFYFLARKTPIFIIPYSFVLMTVCLSPFYNLFLLYPLLFSCILQYFIVKNISRNKLIAGMTV